MDAPPTLQQAIIYFSDADRAFQYALNPRWPNGLVTCPRCGSEKHSFIKTRRIWHCKGCKKQFTLKVGTIFEDSPLRLEKWHESCRLLSDTERATSQELTPLRLLQSKDEASETTSPGWILLLPSVGLRGA